MIVLEVSLGKVRNIFRDAGEVGSIDKEVLRGTMNRELKVIVVLVPNSIRQWCRPNVRSPLRTKLLGLKRLALKPVG